MARVHTANPTVDRDFELIREIQAGGAGARRAFDALVHRHYDAVQRAAAAWLRNRADADDVVQETFIKVFRHVDRFEFRSSFSTWLVRILRNECATHRARRARHTPDAHLVALIRIAEEQSRERHPGLETDAEAHRGVRRLLAQLPAPDQEVLRLRFFYDLSLEEIALRVGIGTSAVKMRIHRALARFRDRYELTGLALALA